MTYLKAIFLTLLWGLSICPALADVSSYFSRIQSDPDALYAFLKKMPKGGELHYHLDGGAYPETLLALTAKGNFCLNPKSLAMEHVTNGCQGISSKKITDDPDLYQKTVRAWSMKDFLPIPGQESGQDHFFSTFGKFMPASLFYSSQLLAEIMKTAARQNELYLELMIIPKSALSATRFADLIKNQDSYHQKKNALLADSEFQQNIRLTMQQSSEILQKARKSLNCSGGDPACNLTVKFQYVVMREQPINQVFAQALNGFAAAAQSPDLVAVNLVQAEDGIISLRDYQAQMDIFKFLHNLYPDVHISLHAGELAPSSVPPADLRFHIREAIFTGQAERIGHGVDVAYENDAAGLLQHMAHHPIPVEINLISNRLILNIFGKAHPLRFYLNHHVPVVLSSDDEGVLRTDLTRQYVAAAYEHHLDYATLKTISRNALTYSFLPGESLWRDSEQGIAVDACLDRHSPSCREFIANNEKAGLQWALENKFVEFEKQYS